MSRILFYRPSLSILLRKMCTPASAPPPAGRNPMSATTRVGHRPTDFQKFVLVWTKKFKSKKDIPTFVSAETIDRARSEARIKISNILMLLTALASFGAILAGKAAAKRGESVHQMNLDWHKKYDEEQNQKEAANAKKP